MVPFWLTQHSRVSRDRYRSNLEAMPAKAASRRPRWFRHGGFRPQLLVNARLNIETVLAETPVYRDCCAILAPTRGAGRRGTCPEERRDQPRDVSSAPDGNCSRSPDSALASTAVSVLVEPPARLVIVAFGTEGEASEHCVQAPVAREGHQRRLDRPAPKERLTVISLNMAGEEHLPAVLKVWRETNAVERADRLGPRFAVPGLRC